MKTNIYFLVCLLIFTFSNQQRAFPQCSTACTCTCNSCNTCSSCSSTPIGGSCAVTVNVGNTDNSAYTLSSSQTLCIYGTYTGALTLNGGSVLVYSGGSFKPSGITNSSGGTIEVKSGGASTLTSISAFNGDVTINNCGTITSSSSITASNNGHSIWISNSGSFTSTNNITLTTGSTTVSSHIYNCGTMSVNNIPASGSSSSTLTISNSGSLTTSGSISLTGSSTTENIYNCSSMTTGGVNVTASGGTLNVSNSGTITSTGAFSNTGTETVNFNNCSSATTTFNTISLTGSTAVQAINNCNKVNTTSTFDFTGNGDFCNSGTWTSGGKISITGSGTFRNNGIISGTSLDLTGSNPVYNNGKIYLSGDMTQTGSSVLNVCQNSYIKISGNWTSTGGKTIGVSSCAAISVGQTSTCTGCTFTGYVDLCDKSSPAPTNGPIYVDNNTGGTWGPNVTYCSCYVLPITLLYFDASTESKKVKLSWATASEINNDHFTIERSNDGYNFEPIATLKGAGNTTKTVDYAAMDENPLPGKSFYRLRQTDFDGHFTFSQPVAVNVKDIMLSVSPNPADNELKCFLFSEGPDYGMCSILDASGKLYSSKELSLNKGTTTFNYNVTSLSKGVYILRIETAQGFVFERFVK